MLKRGEYLEGSCRWLLDSEKFNDWKRSSISSILWLHGTAGTGKSVLVSTVIENLRQDQCENPCAAPIAFFYCSRNPGEPERASPEYILRSILEQVASKTAREPIRAAVVEIYKKKKEQTRGRSPEPLTLEETISLLLEIFEENPVAIVIDALDECDPNKRHDLLSALDKIITESASLVRVFVSSRDDGDIVCQLQDSPNIFIRASDNSVDIANYVEEQVSEAIRKKRLIQGRVSGEMKQQIIDTLIDGAQAMFRWVSLQIQQLCDNRRVKHEKDIGFELGKLPKTLWESYDIIYKNILEMSVASQKLAIRTMQVLFCACRRLTPAELIAAVTVDSTGDVLASSEADILNVCCNMVFLDHGVNSFRFAHLSVREYLEERSDYKPDITNLFLLERCLGVFVRGADGTNPTSKDARFCLGQDEIFGHYSSSYWPEHCRLAPVDVDECVILKRFVGDQGATSNAFNKFIALYTARDDKQRRSGPFPQTQGSYRKGNHLQYMGHYSFHQPLT